MLEVLSGTCRRSACFFRYTEALCVSPWAMSVARLTADLEGYEFESQLGLITFVKIDNEITFTITLSIP